MLQGDQGDAIDVHGTRGRRPPLTVTHILDRGIALNKPSIDDDHDVPSRNDPLSSPLPLPAWLW